MLTIRLMRMGTKKRPFYRICVLEKSKPRDSRYIDQIGYYNPLESPFGIKMDNDKLDHWLSVGAQPTHTVAALIKRHKKGPEIYIKPKVKKKKGKAAEEISKEAAALVEKAAVETKQEEITPKEAEVLKTEQECQPEETNAEKAESKKAESAPAEEKPAESITGSEDNKPEATEGQSAAEEDTKSENNDVKAEEKNADARKSTDTTESEKPKE